MDPSGDLLLTILGAVVGALLSFFGPIFIRHLLYRRRPEFAGVWKSSYQSVYEKPGEWIDEDVKVDLRFGRFRMENSDNTMEYRYHAYGDLFEKIHLVGDWISIKPGSYACGTFILTVAPSGDMVYGYWSGPAASRAQRYGRWVMARRESDIEKAKELLSAMTIRESQRNGS